MLQTRGTEIAPEARGTAISFFVFALFMGGAIGTALLGVVLDARGFTTTIAAGRQRPAGAGLRRQPHQLRAVVEERLDGLNEAVVVVRR